MDIFRDQEDFKLFLFRLKENLFPPDLQKTPIVRGRLASRYVRKSLPANSFTLLSYCLMPNHFHFLMRQNFKLPISKLVSKLGTSYSKYFNKKYERVGHIFQDAFKAVRIESDSQLLWVSAYIHQNPRVAGLVENLGEYPWSSYLDYAGLRNGSLCDQSLILGMTQNNRGEYGKFVAESFEKIKQRKELELLLLD